MSQSKLERLMNLIAYLTNARRALTIHEIIEAVPGYPESFNSARRTFERDKEELRAMNFDVVVEPNPSGDSGYRIKKETTYFEVPLNSAQRNIVDYALAQYAPEEGLAKTSITKIGGANPDNDLVGIRSLPVPENLDQLYAAIKGHEMVKILYKEVVRNLVPTKIVAKNGFWYFEAFDIEKEVERTFRVDRVQEIIETNQFDNEAINKLALEEDLDETITVRITIDPIIVNVFLASWSANFDDTNGTYTLEVNNMQIFLNSIFDYSGLVNVVEPKEIVQEIKFRIDSVLAQLGEGSK